MPGEGTPSPGEGPCVRGERFLLTFLGACKKVSRRKGETLSRRYRRNGYVPNQPRTRSAPRPPGLKIPLIENIQRTRHTTRRLEINPLAQLVTQGNGISRLKHPNAIAQTELLRTLPLATTLVALPLPSVSSSKILDPQILRQAASKIPNLPINPNPSAAWASMLLSSTVGT